MTDLTNLNLRQFRPIPLVRNSERESFNTCHQQWWWRWNMGLVPAMPKQDARWFGTGWHLVWAEKYTPPPGKDGFTRADVNPHDTWDQFCQNTYAKIAAFPYFSEDDEKEYVDAVVLGHNMIDGQLAQWNLDPGFEVLMPEQRFKANIPFNIRQRDMPLSHWVRLGYPRGGASGGIIATAVGTLDLPVRDHTDGQGTITMLDWKTTRDRRNLKQMNKDNQFGTYISVTTGYLRKLELITDKEAVERGIISFARKAKIDNRPTNDAGQYLNKDGSVSKVQGSPRFWREVVQRNKANRLRQITRIADDVEHMQAVRLGVMPVTKSPSDHCNWCDFTDLCDVDEDGGDVEGFIKDVYRTEDPYADHQAGARNSKETVAAKRETGVT